MSQSNSRAELPRYLAKHIPKTVDQVSKLQNDQTINFIFMTDPHHELSGNQLRTVQAIQKITEEIPLDFVMVGGDLSANDKKEKFLRTQREITDALKNISIPVFIVKGNHDDNSIIDYHYETGGVENLVSTEETYELTCEHLENTVVFDENNKQGLYYYYDIPEKQTRVISLDSIDIPYIETDEGVLKYNGQWKYAFSNQQLNWMAHQALNFNDKEESQNWNVIVLSHVAILQEDVFGADHDVENGQVMWDLLRAFQKGDIYQSKPTTGDFEQSVSVDFRSQGPLKVLSSFFGHVHYDQGITKDDLLMISSLNAVTGMDFKDSPKRKHGNISETAFDIGTIDLAKQKVYLTRFGAGKDRMYHIP